MREIVFDTETTGFDPHQGHKLVEIGAVEIMHGVPTGKHYHVYLNPERDVPAEAQAVHGLSTAFLRDKKTFAEEVDAFLDFIAEDRLIAHNASFDMNFVNYELNKLGFPPVAAARVTDTLQMAREKFPGSPASLDALCKRFEIDNSSRTLHGALLDAQLLAHVYVELTGGKQRGFDLVADEVAITEDITVVTMSARSQRTPRFIEVSDVQRAAHAAMLEKLKDPLWRSAG